jgi:hypothetical protein
MIRHVVGMVTTITPWNEETQELQVEASGEARRALNYVALTGTVRVGEEVLLNTTAQRLNLGTGGYDFVVANLSRPVPETQNATDSPGHIIKGRYLPCQQAVLTLEEQEQYADIWERTLEGFPVLVGQLHSQIAPAAAALHLSGRRSLAYIMTDAAALPLEFSRLVHQLKRAKLVNLTITCGQAFGGNWETVTLHSALLAAKHIGGCDAAIVCQGPGNAGTGTKYGFSGIEQAQHLDTVKALGGTPIAIVRMSSADGRARHQGISHHTRTTLDLAYARCIVALPAGADDAALPPGHDVRFVEGADAALRLLDEMGVQVTTMGRTPAEDMAFFLAAAAAGLVNV